MHLDRTEIPSGNILERWRKDVVDEDIQENNANEESNSVETAAYYIQKKLMVKRVLAMAGVDGTLDESGYIEAMAALDRIISVKTTGASGSTAGSSENETTGPTSCPARPSKKGRLQNTSLKSYGANLKKQKTS